MATKLWKGTLNTTWKANLKKATNCVSQLYIPEKAKLETVRRQVAARSQGPGGGVDRWSTEGLFKAVETSLYDVTMMDTCAPHLSKSMNIYVYTCHLLFSAKSCPALCKPMDYRSPATAPLPMGLPRQEHWVGCHCLLQGGSLNPHLLLGKQILHRWATRKSMCLHTHTYGRKGTRAHGKTTRLYYTPDWQKIQLENNKAFMRTQFS